MWKSRVKKTYKSIDLYIYDNRKSLCIWWQYVKHNPSDTRKCMLIVRLLLNCYRLGRKRCYYCNDHNLSSLPHILFECESVKTIRDELWSKANIMNPNMFEAMDIMDTKSRCMFILNGFYSSYVNEWFDLYKHIVHFIFHVYQQYYRDVIVQ